MGCDCYDVPLRKLDTAGNAVWGLVDIRFSEGDEDYGCLCTFPHNYMVAGKIAIDKAVVRSLAVLGAMVVLAHQGKINHQNGYSYIPSDVPEELRQQIDGLLLYRPE